MSSRPSLAALAAVVCFMSGTRHASGQKMNTSRIMELMHFTDPDAVCNDGSIGAQVQSCASHCYA